MPEPRPVVVRVDESAGDIGGLVDLGYVDPQPTPAPSTTPFLEPTYPGLPDGYIPSED